MSGRPWYAHYLDAYARDTAHLTMLQHGAYRLLLDHYYATSNPLPANAEQLHRICRANEPQEIAAVDFVVAEFFHIKRGKYHQKKCDSEITRAAEISVSRSNAATKRHSKSNANAEQLDTHSTLTSTLTKKVSKKEESISAVPASRPNRKNALNGHQSEFEAFYAVYPKHKKRGDAEKAYVAALSLTSPEEILAGAMRYATERAGQDEQYTQLPGTWLRAKCWLDETGQGTTPVDPEKAAEAKEKADQFLRRGKYAETHS